MNKALLILFLCGIGLCSGCATPWVRMAGMADPDLPAIYPATYTDLFFITAPVSIPISASRDDSEHNKPSKKEVFGMMLISPLIIGAGIIDLPVAIVTDTICLPNDLKQSRKNKEQHEEHPNEPREHKLE